MNRTEMMRLAQAFAESHRYLYCPTCRKRVSARYDSIDASFDDPIVRMQCPHCGERFEVAR